MTSQIFDYSMLAQTYSAAEHLDKFALYLRAFIPVALGLLMFLGIGYWWARRKWHGFFIEMSECQKADQKLFSEYANTVDDQTCLLESLKEDYTGSLNEITDRDKSIAFLNTNVSKLEGLKSGIQRELNSRDGDLLSLKTKLDEQVVKRGDLDGELKILSGKVVKANKESSSLQSRINQLEPKLKDSEKEISDLNNANTKTKAAASKVESELNQSLKAKDAKLAELEAELVNQQKDYTVKLKGLQVKNQQLKADADNRVKARDGEIEGLKTDLVKRQKDFTLKLNSTQGNSQQVKADADKMVRVRDGEIKGLKANLVEQAQKTNKQIKVLEDSVAKATKDNAAMQNRVKQLEPKLKEREQEIAGLKKTNANFTKSEGELYEFIEEKDAKQAELEAELVNQQKDYTVQLKGLQAKKQQVEADASKVVKIRENEIKELKVAHSEHAKKTSKQIQFLEESVADREAKLDKASRERSGADKMFANKIAELNKFLVTRDREIETLKVNGSKDKDSSVKKFTFTLSQKDVELDKLNDRVSKLDGEVKDRDIKIKSLGNANLVSTKDLNKQKADLNAQITKLNKAINERDDELNEWKLIHTNLNEKIKTRNKEVNLVTAQKKDVEKQLTIKLKEMGGLQTEAKSKDKTVNDLSGRLKDRELEISGLVADKEKISDQVVKRDGIIAKFKGDVATKDTEIARLRKLAKDKNALADLLAEMEGSLNSKNKEIRSIEGQIAKLKTSVASKETEIGNKEGQIAKLKTFVASKDTEIGNREGQIAKLKTFVASKDTEIGNREGQITKLKTFVASKDTEIGNKEGQIAKLKTFVASKDTEIGNREGQITKLKTSVASKDTEIARLRKLSQDNNTMGQLLSDMEQALNGKESEIKGIESNKTQLANQVAIQDSQLKTLKEQVHSANSKWTLTSKELQSAMSKVKHTEAQLEQAENEFSLTFTPLGAFKGEPVIEHDKLGVVFTRRPEVIDDLKLISGVASVLEGKLHEHGVYRFKQIAIWSQEQIEEFGEQLSFKDRIASDLWVNQAADLHRNKYDEHLTPRVDIYRRKSVKTKAKKPVQKSLMDRMFKGENVVENDKLGIVFQERPNEVDDLKAIKGVAGVLEQQLHEHGVYRYKQIATWTPMQIEEFGEQLRFKDRIDRDLWVHQAIDLHQDKYGEYLQPRSRLYQQVAVTPKKKSQDHVTAKAAKPARPAQPFKGEKVKQDKQFGLVFTERPSEVDDLKKISGVGKVLEGALNKFGVYRFKQIALWPENVVREFVDNLPFGDRVTRDKWIDQAVALHKEKYQEAITL